MLIALRDFISVYTLSHLDGLLIFASYKDIHIRFIKIYLQAENEKNIKLFDNGFYKGRATVINMKLEEKIWKLS